MDTDEKIKNDETSAGDASGGEAPEIEELIDLVDEVSSDDDSSDLEKNAELESKAEEDDEEVVELTDVVEEDSAASQIGDTPPEAGADEILEPEREEDAEEEPIELTDEVVSEVDSTPEQEEGIEQSDLVGEDELAELSEEDIIIPDPEEDTLVENLGIELTEEGFELSEELESEEPDVEFAQEASLSEGAPELAGRAFEQAVLDKLSGEKLEEIATRIVRRTIVDKVERILLEAAETAIAEEIERLKQAL